MKINGQTKQTIIFFSLVLELYKLEFMKYHLSMRIDKTLGSIIKGNVSISYGNC